ncbi:MAG: hypothetical protein WC700_17780 [Gemmatimonadaceae bacterium]|jgi:hypothetical protein
MSNQHLALPAADTVVTAVLAFPTAAQITAPFEPQSWAFRHTGTAGVIEISFNGVDVHARLQLATDASSIGMAGSDRSVWFRRQAAGAGVASVEALASQDR